MNRVKEKEMVKISKTMLTYDTLSRFEETVNADVLTAEQVKEVEHCAYCANMGAKSEEDAWAWFCHLVEKYLKIKI